MLHSGSHTSTSSNPNNGKPTTTEVILAVVFISKSLTGVIVLKRVSYLGKRDESHRDPHTSCLDLLSLYKE